MAQTKWLFLNFSTDYVDAQKICLDDQNLSFEGINVLIADPVSHRALLSKDLSDKEIKELFDKRWQEVAQRLSSGLIVVCIFRPLVRATTFNNYSWLLRERGASSLLPIRSYFGKSPNTFSSSSFQEYLKLPALRYEAEWTDQYSIDPYIRTDKGQILAGEIKAQRNIILLPFPNSDSECQQFIECIKTHSQSKH